jgi:nucleotide-binding universal stress UspA family protein
VTARRGFGDETWRLAQERDAAALHRAADLLLEGDPGGLFYDGHRARAFALAIEDRVDDALAELNEGWTEDWPFPAAYAVDTARVRYLSGDYEHSLGALRLAVHGADRLDPAVADLVAALVARAPRLRLRAVKVVLGGGTPWQRLRNAAAAVSAH